MTTHVRSSPVLQSFLFENLPVRGAIVRVQTPWPTDYPAPAAKLLGEMSAAAVLMHGSIQFEGTLVLQIMGDAQKDASPIKLAVAEVRTDASFRATAKLVHALQDDHTLGEMVNAGGRAHCAITLDPDQKSQGQQAYQGIVSLLDDAAQPFETIAQVLEHYMRQSEQLDTQLVLAADGTQAAGIMIQRVPVKGVHNLAGAQTDTTQEDQLGHNEDYNRIAMLTASIKPEELLGLDLDDVLHRLFWNEPIVRYAPRDPAPRFRCTCSRERVAKTIRSLGQSEAEKLIEDQNGIQVQCDFCGQSYDFDVVDAAMLFVSPVNLA